MNGMQMKNDVHQKIEVALKIMEDKDASAQMHTLRELGRKFVIQTPPGSAYMPHKRQA